MSPNIGKGWETPNVVQGLQDIHDTLEWAYNKEIGQEEAAHLIFGYLGEQLCRVDFQSPGITVGVVTTTDGTITIEFPPIETLTLSHVLHELTHALKLIEGDRGNDHHGGFIKVFRELLTSEWQCGLVERNNAVHEFLSGLEKS